MIQLSITISPFLFVTKITICWKIVTLALLFVQSRANQDPSHPPGGHDPHHHPVLACLAFNRYQVSLYNELMVCKTSKHLLLKSFWLNLPPPPLPHFSCASINHLEIIIVGKSSIGYSGKSVKCGSKAFAGWEIDVLWTFPMILIFTDWLLTFQLGSTLKISHQVHQLGAKLTLVQPQNPACLFLGLIDQQVQAAP